jgi:hypothetical protein
VLVELLLSREMVGFSFEVTVLPEVSEYLYLDP